MFDRFVESDESRSRCKTSLRNELATNRRALSDTRTEIAAAEEQLDTLPGLQETIERFQKAGLEDRLREQSLLVREKRVLGSVPQRLAPFGQALDMLRKETLIDLAFQSERALAELQGKEILSRLNHALGNTGNEIERIANELLRSLNRLTMISTKYGLLGTSVGRKSRRNMKRYFVSFRISVSMVRSLSDFAAVSKH